jgi:trimeric autotransporter adhesin
MRKLFLPLAIFFSCYLLPSCQQQAQHSPKVEDVDLSEEKEEEEEGYDEAERRDELEFEKIKDPALGYVPMQRMMQAMDFTSSLRTAATQRGQSILSPLTWTERGPNYDLVGPDNGNGRAGVNYTYGRISAVLVDVLNDATGNTAFVGGVAGGLWRCTNFLSAIPNWQPIDDRFDNLAVSSICQDPSNPAIMYFSTGEATSNSDAVYGGGIWKSVDAGLTWTRLPSSIGLFRTFKIVCDAAGNVYVGNRSSVQAGSFVSGLYRSINGGSSWVNITPSPITASNNICTDIEISSTGTLHASFGYASTKVQHLYTLAPATVTPATWTPSVGIRIATTSAYRLELAVLGTVVYAVTVNSSSNLDSCYKSTNGGATFTKQNSTAFAGGILNGQGWYNIALAINPDNANEFIVGGLDAYRSTNSGSTIPAKITNWVNTAPYVHADHHFMQWFKAGGQNKLIIGCDGGIFYSADNGLTWQDKNRNLAIKQFYAGAIHPGYGSNYLLAGAQDNGVHQLTNAGLSWSTEVTGGDGCFVHINQQNPQIQIGSYVGNVYRVSKDGGTNWTSTTISANGLFVNPFDYDDGQNIMYSSNGSGAGANSIVRWSHPEAAGIVNVLTISAMTRTSAGYATAFKVSPFTKDRVYIGTNNGKVLRLDAAGSLPAGPVDGNVTTVANTNLPSAYISCVNVGTNEQNVVATFSSYGVSHVWITANGGTNWTNIDGNLPDMHVRWAMFDPQNNSKMILATEAGIYYTDAINGSSTIWQSDANFPCVRTDMLKLRLSDNTIVAATHGRGLFTGKFASTPEVRFASPFVNNRETTTGSAGCRSYKEYSVEVGITDAPAGDAIVTYSVAAGNTALPGYDFDFTTNGDFTAPSNQHLFTNGVATAKNITIRIYDDAEIENAENFKLIATVSGATNAFAGSYKTYEITIEDNDTAPLPPGVGPGTVGDMSYSGGYIQPFRGNYQKSKSQYIYLASELTEAGFVAGNITALGFNVLNKTSTSAYNGFTIGMKHTTSTEFPTIDFETGAAICYSSSYSTVLGQNTLSLSTPFAWDGTSNLLVEFCYDNTTIPGGSGDNISSSSTVNAMGIWNRASTGTGCTLSAAYSSSGGYVRADLTFTLNKKNNPAETALNSAKSHVFGKSNGTVHFYNTNGKIIASMTSQTDHDYGCTEVKIDRAGTSATAFTNNTTANFLMDKTFVVTPGANNSSGSYQITLYYSAAEKAGWEAATGQSWNNIKLFKVKSQILNYTPANPNPDGVAPEIVTPVQGTFGNDYTLTFTFNSGFSGFGAGIPQSGCSLPVITTPPANVSQCSGTAALFSVSATGSGLTYQWRKNSLNIAGATSASFAIPSLAAADAGSYDVVVTNSCGSTTSIAATLSLTASTSISTHPASQAICTGANATLSVVASGSGLTYQWSKDGTVIPGATGSTYTIVNTTTASAGNYTVAVTGPCGTVVSNVATLVILTGSSCGTAVSALDPDISTVRLMPNIVRTTTVLELTTRRTVNTSWGIYDANGRMVRKFDHQFAAGKTTISLNLVGLAPGSYYLVGNSNRGRTGSLVFIKQ